MAIENETFAEYRRLKKIALLEKLTFHEPGNDTEHEIWIDRETMTKYKVAVETVRDFDNMEEL